MVGRIVLSLCVIGWSVAHATQIRIANIEDLVEKGDRIFLGRVLSVDDEVPTPARKFPAVVITFRVEEVYKGAVGEQVVVRQLGTKTPRSKLNLLVPVPRFAVGEEAVVFLPKESSIGFSSPVGFGQGVFRLGKRNRSDEAFVSNETGNARLFHGIKNQKFRRATQKKEYLETAGGKGKALTLGDLKELIELHRQANP